MTRRAVGGYARLLENAAATVAGRLVSVALALVSSTVLFRRLGPGAYGVWSFCYVLVGYLTFVDFGLGATVERLVARAHAIHDAAAAGRALRFAITGATGIAVVAQAMLLLVPTSMVTAVDLRPVTFVLPGCLFLSLMSTVTGAAVSGVQAIARLNLLRTGMNLVSTTLVIVLAAAGVTRLEWLLVAHGAGLAGAAFLSAREVGRRLGPVRWGGGWDRALAGEFLRFGGQMQVATFGPQLADQAFRLLLGARFGAPMIGFYDLGSRAGFVLRSVAGALLVAMVPMGTHLHHTEGRGALNRLYRVGVRYSALCLLPATALALYHSRVLIDAWLPGAAGGATVLFVFRTTLVANAVAGLAGPVAMVARSVGVPAAEAVVQAIAGVAGLGAAVLVGHGAQGSTVAFTGAAAVGAVVLWGHLARRLAFASLGVVRDLLGIGVVTCAIVACARGADWGWAALGIGGGGLGEVARVGATSLVSLLGGALLAWGGGLVAPDAALLWRPTPPMRPERD